MIPDVYSYIQLFGFVLDCLREVDNLAGVDRSQDVVLGVNERPDMYD